MRSTSARFFFTAGDATTVQCSLDGGDWVTCQAPASHEFSDLAQGAHTFRVRGIDAVGNANGPIGVQEWIVDTIAPETVIDQGPEDGAATTSTQTTFAFRTSEPEDDAGFECKLDGGAFGPCSGPGSQASLTSLGVATHTFSVRATDAAGNADPSPASRTWAIFAPPNLDVDGDGYQRRPTGPDCSDAAGAIHPAALDLPENGVDEDCDGGDSRYAALGADVRATWRFIGRTTRVVRLVATRVPGGTRITLRCTGKGCPRGTRSVRVRRDTPEVVIGRPLRKPLMPRARHGNANQAGRKGLACRIRDAQGRPAVAPRSLPLARSRKAGELLTRWLA